MSVIQHHCAQACGWNNNTDVGVKMVAVQHGLSTIQKCYFQIYKCLLPTCCAILSILYNGINFWTLKFITNYHKQE